MRSTTMGKVLISVFMLLLILGNPAGAQPPEAGTLAEELHTLIDESPVFSKIFTGFYLFDPEDREVLYEKDASKYFTPASNTKIFTFYTALNYLGDSLNAARYVTAGDTTVLWGSGNPLLFHPDIPHDSTVYDRMREIPGELFYSDFNFDDERFGPGWSWSEYQYSYQPERSSMPLYGNLVRFKRDSAETGITLIPEYFRNNMHFDPELSNTRARILREADLENEFSYNTATLMGMEFEEDKTFHITPELTADMLEYELGRPVGVAKPVMNLFPTIHAISMPTPDTLYKRLMKDSDNFIAEQLLLMVSDKLFGVQNADMAIDYAKATLYRDAPDELVWNDGSGLSRYNLFTPRTVVHALYLIYQKLPEDRLLNIFPAGGVSGTIQSWYAGPEGEPFVFAKTGTLSNKHCLSGYLRTESGKLLIFSFMHNNYIDSSSNVKLEMDNVLNYIRLNVE